MLLKKLKSKRGISLPVAMAITAVLVILSTALIAIAATSVVNTSSSVSSRQAYLNVRSALEYAYAYYSDSESVPDLSVVTDEYMVMLDKEGGTTSLGAKIGTKTAAQSSDVITYVRAKYIEPATKKDVPSLKLTAFSKSSDAFGKRTQNVQMSAIFTLNKLANKNRVTLTDIDMNTEVEQYETVRNAISLHAKQYPGENWTPFYYLWTYKDKAELYRGTYNCYGVEAAYKNASSNSSGTYNKQSGGTAKISDGFNQNEDDRYNLLAPCGFWNVVKDSHGNDIPSSPENGPASSFSSVGNGWYDATYYIVDDTGDTYSNGDKIKQVNYFNFIITRKGKVLNDGANFNTVGVQTNEMFHLWFLNNTDRNIYFEFLRPSDHVGSGQKNLLTYTPGKAWRGIEELDDGVLVYVQNRKTTIHFKVKGLGDSTEDAVKPQTDNPVITSILKNGESVIDSGSYNELSNAINSGNNLGAHNSALYEKLWTSAGLNGSTGQTDMTSYFYNLEENSHRMLYEGCGWWVCNVGAAGNLMVTVSYSDKNNNRYSVTKQVTTNTSSETYLVVDPETGASWDATSEEKANYYIGADMSAYSTIRFKSNNVGSIIAPYLDYAENNISSTERRLLLEAIENSQQYVKDDYEEDSYNVLSEYVKKGIALYNETAGNAKANREKFVELTDKINEAIKALRTRACSTEIYAEFEAAVHKAEAIEKEQNEKKIYDGSEFLKFNTDDGIYKRCKALLESGEILDKTTKEIRTVTELDESGNPVEKSYEYTVYAYSTTDVYKLTKELTNAITEILGFKLDKDELKKLIDQAKEIQDNTLYSEESRNELKTYLPTAETVYRDSTSAGEIIDTTAELKIYIDDVIHSSSTQLDKELLGQYITDAERLVDPNVTKADFTDETREALSTELTAAKAVSNSATAKQEDIDKAAVTLKEKIDAFTVVKPSVSVTENQATTDWLASQHKIRIWVRGANQNTHIKGRTRDGQFENYDYVITGFALMDPVTGYTLSSSYGHVIESQNLTYFDVDDSLGISGFKLQLDVLHNIYDYSNFNSSTQTYAVKSTDTFPYVSDVSVNLNDVTDGNFVIDVGDLTAVSNDGKAGVAIDQLQPQDIKTRTVAITKRKLTEYYISGYANAEVQVYNNDGSSEIYPATSEGIYQVSRFLYDANQKAVVKAYDQQTNSFVFSNTVDVSSGQKVIELKGSNRTNLNRMRLTIPYDVTSIPGDTLSQIYVSVYGANYTPVYDGSRFVFEIDFAGIANVTVTRSYVLNGETITSTSEAVSIGSAGVFDLEYYSQTGMTALARYKSVSETLKDIPVENIYPKYGETSGSGSGSTSALNGIVSDKIMNTVLGISPTASSIQTPFDYFGQSGMRNQPTMNTGTTIIWIDTNEDNVPAGEKTFFKGKDLKNLRVYAWYETEGGELIEPCGGWPGMEPIRVAQTDYYYLPVDSSTYACILNYGDSNSKIGSDELIKNYSGKILFDYTDLKHVNMHAYLSNDKVKDVTYTDSSGTLRQGYKLKSTYRDDLIIVNEPSQSFYSGQGTDSLFECIDHDVLSGKWFLNTKEWNKDGTSPNQVDTYCNKAPGKVVKNGPNLGNNYFTEVEITRPDGSTGTTMAWYSTRNKYDMYESANYYYRAKSLMDPPYYEYEEPYVDLSDMTATDLRMAFVGGSKIRLRNYSYYYSYGTIYSTGTSHLTTTREHSKKWGEMISTSNYFGGGGGLGGNRDSMGRIGDTTFSMYYDWYEYKIPVDQSNTYNIQFKSVKYNSAYVASMGAKKWYVNDYKTDTQYTEQIKNIYGNVNVVMKDTTTVVNDKFTNMMVYTNDPESVQVKDSQDIYVRLPNGWKNLEIHASGVGEKKEFTLSDGITTENGYYKASIPASTPFLDIMAIDASGYQFTCSTSVQSNDMKLFDPTFRAGTGGWDNYITDTEKLEQILYEAQSIYYGSVLPKSYNSQGIPENTGGNGYDYAKGLKSQIIDNAFSGERISSSGYGMSYGTVSRYVNAYKNLYATLASARAYLKGHNYPEYMRSQKAVALYDETSLEALETAYGTAKDNYINSTSVAEIESQVTTLKNAISNLSISTDSVIPLIFYDASNYVASGSTFEIEYSTTPTGTPKSYKVDLFNTEHCPIYFVRADKIYNVRFIIDGTEQGVIQKEIERSQGAWVYMALPKRGNITTAYWVQNAAADYRQISNTDFIQKDASEQLNYYMMNEGTKESKGAASELEAQAATYRPITFYFKNDVNVKMKDGTSYKIRAGAYTFESNSSTDPSKSDHVIKTSEIHDVENGVIEPNSPLVYTQVGAPVNGWIPTMNLYSKVAKKYFEQPSSYFKYEDNSVNAEDLTNWVKVTGSDMELVASSGHNSSKTVNLTANAGFFAANRPWNYMSKENFYFRWEGNTPLKVKENVSIAAKEIVFASSGKVDVTYNYGKHIYFKPLGSETSMRVIFPTDLYITYIDNFRQQHSFTIREGAYIVSKDKDNKENFICDLCDEDYWESMEYVTIDNRYESLGGGYSGTGGSNTRFGSAVYSEVTSDDL